MAVAQIPSSAVSLELLPPRIPELVHHVCLIPEEPDAELQPCLACLRPQPSHPIFLLKKWNFPVTWDKGRKSTSLSFSDFRSCCQMVQAIPKPRTVSVLYPGSVQRTQSAEAALSLSASTLMHTHTCPLSGPGKSGIHFFTVSVRWMAGVFYTTYLWLRNGEKQGQNFSRRKRSTM